MRILRRKVKEVEMRYIITIGVFMVLVCCVLAVVPLGVAVILRASQPVVAPSNAPVAVPPSAAVPNPPTDLVTGYCNAKPVNPQDDVNVPLNTGDYVIEEFDNRVTPAVHKFWAYSVSFQGTRNVWAVPEWGMRAWRCTSQDVAFQRAVDSAVGYKQLHPDHNVIGPDGKEVR